MPVIEDHPPFGLGISARYAGDRGAERPVLEPHDHLHNKHERTGPSTWRGESCVRLWCVLSSDADQRPDDLGDGVPVLERFPHADIG
jgi:hypothetical protein